jgi:sugar (pentulose or hexulose) kinase
LRSCRASALIDEARVEEPGSSGVVFLPHLAYAPPPAPDIGARGAFIGLAASCGRGAVYRAVLEGIALQVGRVVDGLAALPGVGRPREYRLIGGSSRNPLLVAIKAAVFGAPVVVIDQPEATALGAALLAGIAAELWPDLDAALAAIERHERVGKGLSTNTIPLIPPGSLSLSIKQGRIRRAIVSPPKRLNPGRPRQAEPILHASQI